MPMFMWFGPGQIRFWDFFGFYQARLKPDPVRGMIKFSLVRTLLATIQIYCYSILVNVFGYTRP